MAADRGDSAINHQLQVGLINACVADFRQQRYESPNRM